MSGIPKGGTAERIISDDRGRRELQRGVPAGDTLFLSASSGAARCQQIVNLLSLES